ncbi:MAG TPA: type II toxin-antitoxin system RelE/ParE family toxin [Tepidisphaeraceae bacterium]|nr:type II toxin-antitoxin system RelE/ParE family toxin [Tepidisphaeraceae bacterium]
MNAGRVLVRPQAEDEIDEIARYIALRNLDAGKAFYDAIENALKLLAEHPGVGALRQVKNPKLHGLRSWPLTGYRNYLVFYLPLPSGGVEVLHVLHGARSFGELLERG